LPEFPGGKAELVRYLQENLQYPELARTNRIEGVVHVKAVIDDNGTVCEVHVEKGLGHGCDEEAIRLISSISFGDVKNRGKKVKVFRKFRIEFKLPRELAISYNVKPGKAEKSTKPATVKENYSYIIQYRRD